MLFKLAGAILVIAGTAAWGISGVQRLKGRVVSLRSITGSLEIMEGEICDKLTPMPELMEFLSEGDRTPAARFYRNVLKNMHELGESPFPGIWRKAVYDTVELMLTEEEAKAFGELGLSLGRYDVEQQRSAITYIRRRMDAFAEKAAAERDANSRVHAFLGVAAGVFAVIMLL